MVADSVMERMGVMPKINIQDYSVSGSRVEIGWTARHDDTPGVVQVGTTNEESPFSFPESDECSSLPFNGWFATLDREQINNAIRALRKARDAAYGADA